jgi:hypothetical protein
MLFPLVDTGVRKDTPAEFLHQRTRNGSQFSGLSQVMFELNCRAELFAGAQKILRLIRR